MHHKHVFLTTIYSQIDMNQVLCKEGLSSLQYLSLSL